MNILSTYWVLIKFIVYRKAVMYIPTVQSPIKRMGPFLSLVPLKVSSSSCLGVRPCHPCSRLQIRYLKLQPGDCTAALCLLNHANSDLIWILESLRRAGVKPTPDFQLLPHLNPSSSWTRAESSEGGIGNRTWVGKLGTPLVLAGLFTVEVKVKEKVWREVKRVCPVKKSSVVGNKNRRAQFRTKPTVPALGGQKATYIYYKPPSATNNSIYSGAGLGSCELLTDY